MRARGARQSATVCRTALLPVLVPGRLHLLPAERGSVVGRRDRRTRRGCSDITLSHARLKLVVVWPGCGKRRRPCAERTTDSQSASCPGPQCLLLFSPLDNWCCRSPPPAWISTAGRSLTRPCGRTFGINCSAGHSTSWWLDHRLPRSRLLAATRSMLWKPEFQCKKARFSTVPCRWHTHRRWRSQPQRRAALRNRGREDFWIFLCAPTWTRRLCFARCLLVGRPLGSGNAVQRSPPNVQSAPIQGDRWSATATGTPFESEGSSCSAPLFAAHSSSVNTRFTVIIANHLRGSLPLRPTGRGAWLCRECPTMSWPGRAILLRHSIAHASCRPGRLCAGFVEGPSKNRKIVNASAARGT